MGTKILYYFILIPISKLPFFFIYLLSDFLYLVIYKLVGYRKAVVRQNIKNSFPEKSESEIKAIESKFYRHLCDLVVESIKAFTISKEEAQKRMVDRNIELVNQYKKKGKHVVLAGGHYGNWELFAITIGEALDYKSIALFTPLKNKFMNDKITSSRSKYGLEMLPIKSIKEKLYHLDGELYTIIFGADQSPRKGQRAYWMTFLNQETGVQFGTEKFAVEFDAVVVFANIYKIKRGYYEVAYEVICENAKETEYGFISQEHTKRLEKVIQAQPEYWLWSHKRWKHKRPEGEVLN
ncbi:MAG: lauroyl acyltransferase [Bacteroidetes bacterium]|nr:MAG: lauroyl acyltransferase [Bacteroidota bacterium]MBL1145914.1 lauroyl acyltransferase [Bacteroidota bacterium]NOG58708.1 lauroyl acyltransferase [Bacteroidota bacterium]